MGVSRAGAGESGEWQAGKEGSGEARDKSAQATVARRWNERAMEDVRVR